MCLSLFVAMRVSVSVLHEFCVEYRGRAHSSSQSHCFAIGSAHGAR